MLTEAGRLARSISARTRFAPASRILALVADEELARIVRDDQQRVAEDRAGRSEQGFACRSSDGSPRMTVAATAAAGAGAEERPARRKWAARPPISTSSPSTSRRTPSKGKIDPVLGRDFEIRQIVDILMRRRQNNPILTGEAGVGKTAVVEGFALRIAKGDVPPPLQERFDSHARSGSAAGRRGHQGRIRKSAERA